MVATTPDDDGPRVKRRGPQWGRVSAAVLRDPRLSVQAKALYALLATYADNDDRDCWPRQSVLAEQLGCSDDSVQRYVRELVRLGAVEVEARYRPDGGRGANDYVLTDALNPRTDAVPPTRTHAGTPTRTHAGTPSRTHAGTPSRTDAVTPPAPMREQEQDHKEQPHVEHHTPATADGGDGELFTVDQPTVTTPPKTAQTLVARWVDGYRVANHVDPPGPVLKRVAGQAKNLANSCETTDDWNAAWTAAYSAGQHGQPDAVPFMTQARSRYANGPRNHDMEAIREQYDQQQPRSVTTTAALELMRATDGDQ